MHSLTRGASQNAQRRFLVWATELLPPQRLVLAIQAFSGWIQSGSG